MYQIIFWCIWQTKKDLGWYLKNWARGIKFNLTDKIMQKMLSFCYFWPFFSMVLTIKLDLMSWAQFLRYQPNSFFVCQIHQNIIWYTYFSLTPLKFKDLYIDQSEKCEQSIFCPIVPNWAIFWKNRALEGPLNQLWLSWNFFW